uniref:NADH dehydrogenase subunit 3 n=1 Tax=Epipenaeon fissurae TaxID=2995643 RepID=UPI0022FDAB93|nr:NADH dehydrogenase subunit 3 [Epipenaeon fissurae]WBK03024.1 NADH dehydrogenase subunit 3 [Epipenaeon fissurae]
MYPLLVYFVAILCVSIVLSLVAFSLGDKHNSSPPMMDPFECGFDPKGSGRVPFSLRFYLIGVIFLVFDVELTFLLPLLPSWWEAPMNMQMGGLFFLMLLTGGTLYEWWQGALDWC